MFEGLKNSLLIMFINYKADCITLGKLELFRLFSLIFCFVEVFEICLSVVSAFYCFVPDNQIIQ